MTNIKQKSKVVIVKSSALTKYNRWDPEFYLGIGGSDTRAAELARAKRMLEDTRARIKRIKEEDKVEKARLKNMRKEDEIKAFK